MEGAVDLGGAVGDGADVGLDGDADDVGGTMQLRAWRIGLPTGSLVEDVDGGASDGSLVEGKGQGRLVGDGAAADVDEDGVGAHLT